MQQRVADQEASQQDSVGWVRRLELVMKALLDVSPVDANSMGRIAGKVESLEDSLMALEKAAQGLDKHGRDYFVSRVPAEDFAPRVSRGWTVGMLPQCDEFSTFRRPWFRPFSLPG